MKNEIRPLPEKWALKVTPESYEKFKHLRPLSEGRSGYITSMPYSRGDWGRWTETLHYGWAEYQEITIQQFEKYVLSAVIEEPQIVKENLSYLIPIIKKLNSYE